eukprot:1097235_1
MGNSHRKDSKRNTHEIQDDIKENEPLNAHLKPHVEHSLYRILLIGMPSSGRKSIFNYFAFHINMENMKMSDAGKYKKLSFLYKKKHFRIEMDLETSVGYNAVSSNYKDFMQPASSPTNRLHGIVFVIDANAYGHKKNKLAVYRMIQPVLSCKQSFGIPFFDLCEQTGSKECLVSIRGRKNQIRVDYCI